MKYQTLLLGAGLLLSAGVYAVPEGASLSVMVKEAEQKGQLPKPILEVMLEDGSNLEKATEITVSTSSTGTYAQGFTYHAICMAASADQAQRVHDIAIGSAADQFKAGVVAEARYSLIQFQDNGCDSVEDINKDLTEETAKPGAEEAAIEVQELVVTIEPITMDAVTGTVAGGASSSQ